MRPQGILPMQAEGRRGVNSMSSASSTGTEYLESVCNRATHEEQNDLLTSSRMPEPLAEPPTEGLKPVLASASQIANALRTQQAQHARDIEIILREQEKRIVEAVTTSLAEYMGGNDGRRVAPPPRPPRGAKAAQGGDFEAPGVHNVPAIPSGPGPKELSSGDEQAQASSARGRNLAPAVSPNTSSECDNDPPAARGTKLLRRGATARMAATAELRKSYRGESMDSQKQYSHDVEEMDQYTNKLARSVSKSLRVLGDDTQSLRYRVMKIVHSRPFEMVSAFLNVANSLVIGVQAEYMMATKSTEIPIVFFTLETLFVAALSIEVFMRLFSEGSHFWQRHNRSWGWNIFDVCIFLTAMADLFLSGILRAFPNMSFVRILRILRLVRVMRLIRVLRFFNVLRILVAGIVSSVKPLMWAMSLLLLMTYIFAVFVLQFVSDYFYGQGKVLEIPDDLVRYKNMIWTLYTLYQAISGGIDWGEAADPLLEISPMLVVFFTMYVSFSLFCVLNIVTAVFVENARSITAQDEDHMILEKLGMKKQWYEEVKNLFIDQDLDGSGDLEFDEFSNAIKDPRIQYYFSKLGVDIEAQSARGLFELLDLEGDGAISLDEFVTGMQMLHGSARSIDIIRLRHDTAQLKSLLYKLLPPSEAEQNKLRGLLASRNSDNQGSGGKKRGSNSSAGSVFPAFFRAKKRNSTSAVSNIMNTFRRAGPSRPGSFVPGQSASASPAQAQAQAQGPSWSLPGMPESDRG